MVTTRISSYGEYPVLWRPGHRPLVMTSADVAQMLKNPDIKIVQHMAREGRIPARRLPGGRKYLFLRDELLAWLRSDETRVTPAAK